MQAHTLKEAFQGDRGIRRHTDDKHRRPSKGLTALDHFIRELRRELRRKPEQPALEFDWREAA